MAEYSEIPAMIRSFKRAAIDAYMRTQPYAWTIEGGHYEIDSSSTHTEVTRPNADGEGAFLEIAKANPQRCVVLDASVAADQLAGAAMAEISRRFPEAR